MFFPNNDIWLRRLIITIIALPLCLTGFIGCSSDDGDSNPADNSGDNAFVLIIENGAQTISPGEALTYSAKLVDLNGQTSTPDNVTWTTSNSDVCTIASNGVVSVVANGMVRITAEATVNGQNLSVSVPLKIAMSELFTVVPGAVIMIPNETIELVPVFFTQGTAPTYSYTSGNTGIATVSATGVITSVSAGMTEISVKATNKNNAEVFVPVLVIGIPEIEIPVTRVELDAFGAEMFRGEVVQFNATAYKSDGSVADEAFTWSSFDNNIASVDSDGLVTAHNVGETTIQAMAKGIFAHADVVVYPDTMVVITPFMVDLNPGEEFQFTAEAYRLTHDDMTLLSDITTFDWYMPDYSVFGPEFEIFNIGTLYDDGSFVVKPDAMIGMSSFVIAVVPDNEESVGVAMITVGFGLP